MVGLQPPFFICKIIITLILVSVNTNISDFNIIFSLTFKHKKYTILIILIRKEQDNVEI